nr:putative ribonuclease H-like domain-containing protein [Tanacetum cinerariifolium]
MTTPNVTSSTDSQMHNNIMAAGLRDRPPMLATGRHPQWRSWFLRYIDTRPNTIPEHTTVKTPMNMTPEKKAHFEAEKEAIHLMLTGIGDEIYSTIDACQTAQEMCEAIERLQQGESLHIQDVKTNLFWEFEWSRFVTIVKQQHKLDEVSYHKLFDILKQYQKEVNELHAERLAKNANPLELVTTAQANQDLYYQTIRSHKSHKPSSKPSIPTIVGIKMLYLNPTASDEDSNVSEKSFPLLELFCHWLEQVEARLAKQRDRELKYYKNKEGLGYSVVPPPSAQIYYPPKKDMSWTGLSEFVDDTITDYSRHAPTVESSPDDAQNINPSVTATEASPNTISHKPFIKFVKPADSPTVVKTEKKETVRKTSIKYAELYRKPSKKLLASLFSEAGVIHRVQRLERELKARTPIQKVDRGRSRSVMAWVPKKRVAPAEEFALLMKIILSQRCINVSQRHIYNSQQLCDSYARMVPAAAKVKEHKCKEIAKLIIPLSETASEEDSDPEQAQRDKDMQKNLALIAKYFKRIYKPTNNNLRTSSNSRNKNVDTTPRYKIDAHFGQFGNQRTVNVAGTREKECRKPKRVKDSAYHKEKMLLCKQTEQGVPLQAKQYDWLADTDEEVDEQEMEAYYSYMAKIQDVPTAETGTDSKPLEHVQNDAGYNVFANDLQHFEQSESVSNTCLVEMDDSNVILDSPDMCEDDIQNDQDDVESDDEHVALANLIANLKLDSNDVKCSYLLSLSDLDALDELQCLYHHKVIECDCLAQKLLQQTESVSKEVHTELLKHFAKVEKHSISLEIALQKHLKAQLQDKNIAISELKKLIEKGKGKSMNTKFDKPSIVRQPNAQRIPKPLVLGKSAPFSNSLERMYFSKTKLVPKANMSEGLSKPVTAQTLPQTARQAVSNTNVLKPGMYRINNSKKSSLKSKAVPSSKGRLNLLHMDLCGPMRVASINGKKYILVIVDDYSRYTCTLFLRSKDETPEVLKEFLTMIQRNLSALMITVRTDRGTKFLNKTLNAFFKEEGIEHHTSTARTPEQNSVVERRNRTLVEAARTMLSALKLLLFF